MNKKSFDKQYKYQLIAEDIKLDIFSNRLKANTPLLYMTGGESHSVRYMRATTKPLVRATSSAKRASPYRLAS